MQGALIMRWRVPRPGHELDAMTLADTAHEFFTRMREDGRVAGWAWYANLSGRDGGMSVVHGDPAALAGVTAEPDFAGIHMRGIWYLEDWRWDMALTGGTADEVYPGWRELVA